MLSWVTTADFDINIDKLHSGNGALRELRCGNRERGPTFEPTGAQTHRFPERVSLVGVRRLIQEAERLALVFFLCCCFLALLWTRRAWRWEIGNSWMRAWGRSSRTRSHRPSGTRCGASSAKSLAASRLHMTSGCWLLGSINITEAPTCVGSSAGRFSSGFSTTAST